MFISSVSYTLSLVVLDRSGGVCSSHLSISDHLTMSSHVSTDALLHRLSLVVIRSPIPTTLVLRTGSGEVRAHFLPLTPCLQPCGFPWICPARPLHLISCHIFLSCSGSHVPSFLAPTSLVALLHLFHPHSIHIPFPTAPLLHLSTPSSLFPLISLLLSRLPLHSFPLSYSTPLSPLLPSPPPSYLLPGP